MTSSDLIKELENPATSYWLKFAATTALKRDLVDALDDIKMLKTLVEVKLNELTQSNIG